MVKVTNPLLSGDARGKFGNKMIFTRGGQVRRYFKPRNPNTEAQQAVREAFKEFSMPGLTQEQADLLYSAILHLHDERYSQLGHLHGGERKRYFYEHEFNGAPTSAPVMFPFGAWGAYASGTVNWITSEANHQGIQRVTSHATNAPSGMYVWLWGNNAKLRLLGGETFEAVIRFPTTTAIADLMGFMSAAVEGGGMNFGAWISAIGTTLKGKTKNGSGSAETGSSYTVSVDVWYRVKVAINADASRVDFYLYNEAGSQLWTDYLTSYIPTGLSDLLGCGFAGIKTTAGAADVLDVDWGTFYSVDVVR